MPVCVNRVESWLCFHEKPDRIEIIAQARGSCAHAEGECQLFATIVHRLPAVQNIPPHVFHRNVDSCNFD